MNLRRLGFLLLFFVAATSPASADKPLAPATIVVFNKDVPESVELAKFYAEKRGIARDHLVGLSISKTEEISRDEYDTMIRDPQKVADKVLSQIQPGDIVLMHDGHDLDGHHRPGVIAALPLILRGLQERGLRSVTVSELLSS